MPPITEIPRSHNHPYPDRQKPITAWKAGDAAVYNGKLVTIDSVLKCAGLALLKSKGRSQAKKKYVPLKGLKHTLVIGEGEEVTLKCPLKQHTGGPRRVYNDRHRIYNVSSDLPGVKGSYLPQKIIGTEQSMPDCWEIAAKDTIGTKNMQNWDRQLSGRPWYLNEAAGSGSYIHYNIDDRWVLCSGQLNDCDEEIILYHTKKTSYARPYDSNMLWIRGAPEPWKPSTECHAVNSQGKLYQSRFDDDVDVGYRCVYAGESMPTNWKRAYKNGDNTMRPARWSQKLCKKPWYLHEDGSYLHYDGSLQGWCLVAEDGTIAYRRIGSSGTVPLDGWVYAAP